MNKRIFLPIFLLSWAVMPCIMAGVPTAKLYKVLRDGQKRDSSIVAMQKTSDGGYVLRIPKKELRTLEFLLVTPSMAVGHQGEKGFFINNDGLQTRFDLPHKQLPYKVQWEEKYLVGDKFKDITDGVQYTAGWDEAPLCISGYHEAGGRTWLAIKEGMKFESRQLVRLKDNTYSLNEAYYLRDIRPYEDLTILFYPVEHDSYTAIALKYRQWLLDHHRMPETIKEKISKRPEIAYASEAPEVRIRMGWKESPSPVQEQTRATEPPMHVAITFDRVCDIIDAMMAKGIKKAELCLVGWNIRGHDGRFPEIFPPDPQLGGYKGLQKVIQKANEAGYRIDLHNNRTDIYSICEDWDNGYHTCKDINGNMKSKFVYGGGMMYDICMKQSYKKFFKRDEPQIAKLGIHGLHFIDVLSIINPHDCFDPRHPLNKKESMRYGNKMLKESQKLFGGSQSEGGKDYTAKVLDYAMYATRATHRPVDKDIFDAFCPIWFIVFNGYIMSNVSNFTVNFPKKPVADALNVVELASRPMFYFYSSFRAKMSQNWMGGELDLRCATDEELNEAVDVIKKGYDIFLTYKDLLKETITDHQELAPKVRCTTFSNGKKVICNYSREDYSYGGTIIPAEGYKIL